MPYVIGLGAAIVTGILMAPAQRKRVQQWARKFVNKSTQAVRERAKNSSKAVGKTPKSRTMPRNQANEAVAGTAGKKTKEAATLARKSERFEPAVGEQLEGAQKGAREA